MSVSRGPLQSQHSSFEDSGTVHPLRSILMTITNEIDQETVHQLICLSEKQLQDKYPALVKECDILAFFNVLEEKYGTDHAADFMETLLEHENLHSGFGEWKLAEGLRQYQAEKKDYLAKCQELGYCQDPYFVGREQIMTEILQHLKNPASESKGVMICGCVGVGKSSLAREVCYKLSNNSEPWQITRVNLRGKRTLLELLRSLLYHVSNQSYSVGLDQASVKSELLNAFKRKAGCRYSRSIVWMDNIDSLCDTMEKWNSLCDFVKEVCNTMYTEEDCQMKLLLTVDENPCTESFDMDQNLEPDLKVVLLDSLSSSESEMLLRKFARLPEEVLEKETGVSLYSITGGNPLALKMFGSLLRNGKSMRDIESSHQYQNTQGPSELHMEMCIHQAFKTLDKKLQVVLVKMLIFKTTPFCFTDAVLILSEDTNIFEKHLKRRKSDDLHVDLSHDLLITLSHLKLCHFIELEDVELTHVKLSKGGQETKNISIHPLIWRHLQKYQKSDDFKDPIFEAKCYFCRYICALINKYIRKFDTDPREVSSMWEENSIYFETWFHFIINDYLAVDKFYESIDGYKSLLFHYRIWRVAQTVLQPSEQLIFLQQQTEFANQSRCWYSVAVWTSFQAEYFNGQNQIEMSCGLIKRIAAEIQEIHFINIINTDNDLSHLVSSFKNMGETYLKEESGEILVACAFYYRTFCGILLRTENLSKTTKTYLSLAKQLFSGKYGKPDVQRHIKRSYKTELAKVRDMEQLFKVKCTKMKQLFTGTMDTFVDIDVGLNKNIREDPAGITVNSVSNLTVLDKRTDIQISSNIGNLSNLSAANNIVTAQVSKIMSTSVVEESIKDLNKTECIDTDNHSTDRHYPTNGSQSDDRHYLQTDSQSDSGKDRASGNQSDDRHNLQTDKQSDCGQDHATSSHSDDGYSRCSIASSRTSSEIDSCYIGIKDSCRSHDSASSSYRRHQWISSSLRGRSSGTSQSLSDCGEVTDRDSYISTDSQNSDMDVNRSESGYSLINFQGRLTRKRSSQNSITSLMDKLSTAAPGSFEEMFSKGISENHSSR